MCFSKTIERNFRTVVKSKLEFKKLFLSVRMHPY